MCAVQPKPRWVASRPRAVAAVTYSLDSGGWFPMSSRMITDVPPATATEWPPRAWAQQDMYSLTQKLADAEDALEAVKRRERALEAKLAAAAARESALEEQLAGLMQALDFLAVWS